MWFKCGMRCGAISVRYVVWCDVILVWYVVWCGLSVACGVVWFNVVVCGRGGLNVVWFKCGEVEAQR